LEPLKKLLPSTEGIKNAAGTATKAVESAASAVINKLKFW